MKKVAQALPILALIVFFMFLDLIPDFIFLDAGSRLKPEDPKKLAAIHEYVTNLTTDLSNGNTKEIDELLKDRNEASVPKSYKEYKFKFHVKKKKNETAINITTKATVIKLKFDKNFNLIEMHEISIALIRFLGILAIIVFLLCKLIQHIRNK